MSRAKTRLEYESAWKAHVAELTALRWHLPSYVDHDKLNEIEDALKKLIETAGEHFAAELKDKGKDK